MATQEEPRGEEEVGILHPEICPYLTTMPPSECDIVMHFFSPITESLLDRLFNRDIMNTLQPVRTQEIWVLPSPFTASYLTEPPFLLP